MDDGIGTKNTQLLWIHWSNHVISFHEEAGYERLEFPTYEKKWNMFLERLPMVFASNDGHWSCCFLNIFDVLMEGLHRRGQRLIFFPDQHCPCLYFR